jgi:hypothetical protein
VCRAGTARAEPLSGIAACGLQADRGDRREPLDPRAQRAIAGGVGRGRRSGEPPTAVVEQRDVVRVGVRVDADYDPA